MMQLPDCRICREDYDLGQRLPVVLTCCGCYICKECARQLNTCPHCYKGIKRFVTNLALRDLIEMQRGLQADRAICPQHHQPLTLLCKSDNQSCCAMCFLTTHREHEYEVLPTQSDAAGTVVSMSVGGYESSTSPCTPVYQVGAAAPAAAVDGSGVSAVHVIFPKSRSEPPSIPAQTEWRPSYRTRFRGFLSSVCAIVSSLIPVIIIVVVLMSLG